MKRIIITSATVFLMALSACAQNAKVKVINKNADAMHRIDSNKVCRMDPNCQNMRIEKCSKNNHYRSTKQRIKLAKKPDIKNVKKIEGNIVRPVMIKK